MTTPGATKKTMEKVLKETTPPKTATKPKRKTVKK